MGSPVFAVPALEHLVVNRYKVVAVYTQPDRPAGRGRTIVSPPVKKAALKLGLPVIQPDTIRSEKVVAELAGLKPDVVVVCAYGQILPQSVLDIPPRQFINIHFSLLPRHRGASPVAAAILAGDEFTGVSIQLVRRKLDTGPLLSVAAVPVSTRDTTGTLTAKLSQVGARLLLESLSGWLRGEITPLTQDSSRATYFSQIKKEEGEINWRLPAVEIWRRIRAFNPWPGCYTRLHGRQLKIVEAIALPERTADIGRVVPLTGEAQTGIGTGEGILRVLSVQLEGKRVMSADEFLRGHRNFIGEMLPSD